METKSGTDRRPTYDPGTAAPPPAQKASVVEDFIDIFYAPSSVFARREQGGVGVPLLIVSLLFAGFSFASKSVFSQIFDAEFSRGMANAMAKNPRLTQDMVSSMRPVQEKIASVFVYLGAPLAIFFTAILVWIVAKALSGKLSFGQSMLVSTLAFIPRLVGSLLGVVQVVLMDTAGFTNRYSLSMSPARFMDADATNPKVFALVGSLDVFAIWMAVLIGIGMAVVGKMPRTKGYVGAAIVFVVATLLTSLFV
ncbi:MAG TPA: Yip1 family protein [Gemmatimonadaceae bacterium]|nr:Yip1 family protein [Gemmatimonadaceae bacterium]